MNPTSATTSEPTRQATSEPARQATSEPTRLGLLVGDGIGHEIVPAARRIADAAVAAVGGTPVTWVPLDVGLEAIGEHGTPMPESTLVALADLDGWVLGPHDSASYPDPFRGQLTPGGTIRKRFDLFANVRPARAFAGVRAVSPEMDLVIVRENTEGFYADRNMFTGSGEFMPTPDVAMAVGVVTRRATERIARAAFELASRRRGRVTVVHKANVLALTTGLFRDVCHEIGTHYPGVEVRNEHVDAMAAHLVRRGEDFDVVVTENMFGDILSDLAGELSGSLGTAPSLNASETKAMAQAAHGAAPDIAGRNRANPTAMILSTAMLFDWLSTRGGDPALGRAAERIQTAVANTLQAGVATADLGGLASTAEFAETVTARVVRR
ncbi:MULTISPECIES: isocitrate/isopropylmalate dehydrogenase family protein [unclassified Rhodococcus (in: high G+C Gram-positive bacteria)]|uniref:isocitrate/isopropylmalate dehydrogenase family protein n=1 Tax=unclassified Rhodococcus (in: high G+C Gram-positive bacteria) TaxID=192944 RepID=UPI001B434711|nr:MULTISPECIES: isocitrate/isopropylmalate family dehydrogenase [unclassified Rhodococcus (in: high G+C Gram-positive bacteria)]MBP1159079.1 3-isopropylmalate dehydrogenase [Rhodococcus sp. PvR099]